MPYHELPLWVSYILGFRRHLIFFFSLSGKFFNIDVPPDKMMFSLYLHYTQLLSYMSDCESPYTQFLKALDQTTSQCINIFFRNSICESVDCEIKIIYRKSLSILRVNFSALFWIKHNICAFSF